MVIIRDAIWLLADWSGFMQLPRINPKPEQVQVVANFLHQNGLDPTPEELDEIVERTHRYNYQNELHDEYRAGCL